jgi:hypothetical protein
MDIIYIDSDLYSFGLDNRLSGGELSLKINTLSVDHLGGYNRVAGSDVPLRQRLYSKGRNYYIRLNANW